MGRMFTLTLETLKTLKDSESNSGSDNIDRKFEDGNSKSRSIKKEGNE